MIKIVLLSLIVALISPFAMSGSSAFGAVMTSSSYSIQSDSVNFGGGQGNSASYRVEDTLGEIATGESESASYKIKAGYQQMVTNYITMTAASDVTMSPALGGLTGGTSNGSTATTITTDNPAGYELYIKASSSPAMQGNTQGDSIPNHAPSFGNPSLIITVLSTASAFGFTPEGVDVASKYLDDGDTCNSGGTDDTVDACWNGVPTTNELIAERTSANTPSGTPTTIKFRVVMGSSAFKIEDTYTATATLTAVSL